MNNAESTVTNPQRSVNITASDIARFWEKVNKDGPIPQHMPHLGKCWVWTAQIQSNGYGRFRSSFSRYAHTFSFVLAFGQTSGLLHLHKCDNPRCVHPDHLFSGTSLDNSRDMVSKGRCNTPRGDRNGSRTHPENLARGEQHGRSKLRLQDVEAIRGMLLSGVVQRKIAHQFHISQAEVSNVKLGKKWAGSMSAQ